MGLDALDTTEIAKALISASTGVAGAKLIAALIQRKQKKNNGVVSLEQSYLSETVAIRKELRDEATRLRSEIDELYAEIDNQRSDHLQLQRKYDRLVIDHESLVKRNKELQLRYQELSDEVKILRAKSLQEGLT